MTNEELAWIINEGGRLQAAQRDATIEECAKVADEYHNEPIANAIRALKGEMK